MRDSLRMPYGVGYRDGAALRGPEERKTAEAGGIDDRLHIPHLGIERKLLNIPIRQAVAARVVSDKGMILGESKEGLLKQRQLPIIFEVTEPMCHCATLYHRMPHRGRSGGREARKCE
jgi:hypothetical protein